METSKTSLVDLFKFFFAIMVVAIHTHAFADFGGEVFVSTYFSSFAVPYFFLASGWFLGVKMTLIKDIDKYRTAGKKYFKRLLIPYLIWSCVQFPLQIFVDVYQSHEPFMDTLFYRFRYWLVSSPGGGLWYIQTTLILVLILCVSNKRSYRIVLSVISLALFLWPEIASLDFSPKWISTSYESFIEYFYTNNNFIIRGIYFLLGFTLAEYNKRLNVVSKYKYLWIFIALMLIYIVSNLFFPIISTVASLLVAVSLFFVTLSFYAPYSSDTSKTLRKLSTIVYFTHIPVKYAIQFIISKFSSGLETVVWLITIVLLLVWSIFVLKTKLGKKIDAIIY